LFACLPFLPPPPTRAALDLFFLDFYRALRVHAAIFSLLLERFHLHTSVEYFFFRLSLGPRSSLSRSLFPMRCTFSPFLPTDEVALVMPSFFLPPFWSFPHTFDHVFTPLIPGAQILLTLPFPPPFAQAGLRVPQEAVLTGLAGSFFRGLSGRAPPIPITSTFSSISSCLLFPPQIKSACSLNQRAGRSF